MRYLFINEVVGTTSTGKIVADQYRKAIAEGNEAVVAYGRWANNCDDVKTFRIGTDNDVKIHGIMTRLFDRHGLCSTRATEKFIIWADEYEPDVVWLHNLHGYYINYEVLFRWMKQHPERQYYWTLHDCWSFTGHCSHFTYVKCDKWRMGCNGCVQKREYPASILLSNSADNYRRKQVSFSGVKNLTIITPSKWLADLVKQSILKEYPVEVRYNTVDKNTFKPTASDFREKNGLQDKKIILAVANIWNERKGLPDVLRLRSMLDDNYAVIIVGLTGSQIREIFDKETNVEEITTVNVLKEEAKKQELHNKVIEPSVEYLYKAITDNRVGDEYKNNKTEALLFCIKRTNNPEELAAIYTAADFFINPTYEDNYPTVNLEAQACGTSVITYDTGGCKETIETSVSN